MRKLYRFVVVATLIALLALLSLTAFAQDGMGPGEGGVIIESNPGGSDPITFNPILDADSTSSTVVGKMFPGLIGLNYETWAYEPGQDGSIAESWEYDETGTVLTVHLRQDITWNDGVPITADDYLYAVEAVRSSTTSSPRNYYWYTDANGAKTGGSIIDYEKIDDYTIQFTIGEPVEDEDGNLIDVKPSCVAFTDVAQSGEMVVPSHLFMERFGEDYAAMDDDALWVPPATFGAFKEPFVETGVQVSLIADQAYPDTALGYVSPSEWQLQVVADSNIAYERFIAGDFTVEGIPGNKINEFKQLASENPGQFILHEYDGRAYTYLGYNTANPDNPQPGLDEDGNVLEQEPHPIFADARVRRAIAYAINVDSIIGTAPNFDTGEAATGILGGNGTRLSTHTSALSWVDPIEEPYPYDPDAAIALLEEAGWVDNDGDGVRECDGCLYAEAGTPLSFELLTNAGNNIREQIIQVIKSDLEAIGFSVDAQAIEWGTFLGEVQGQTMDAFVLGWNLGLPFDPDGRSFFSAEVDIPGAGFGFTSYNNPELNDLWQQAVTVPGCDREARGELYQQAMSILYEEQPYTWIYIPTSLAAAQGNLENFSPIGLNITNDMDAWAVIEQ